MLEPVIFSYLPSIEENESEGTHLYENSHFWTNHLKSKLKYGLFVLVGVELCEETMNGFSAAE